MDDFEEYMEKRDDINKKVGDMLQDIESKEDMILFAQEQLDK